eukprot:gene22522-45033_t
MSAVWGMMVVMAVACRRPPPAARRRALRPPGVEDLGEEEGWRATALHAWPLLVAAAGLFVVFALLPWLAATARPERACEPAEPWRPPEMRRDRGG